MIKWNQLKVFCIDAGEIATTAGWGDNGNIPNTAKPRKADTKVWIICIMFLKKLQLDFLKRVV